MNDSVVKFTIRSSRIKNILALLVVILVLFNMIGLFFNFLLGHDYVYGFVPKFNLDTENNIPTYFSSLLLLIASCLLYLISTAMKKQGDIYAHHWLYLSIIFLCLSIDESSSIHELLTEPLRNTLNLTGILYFSWVVVGSVVFIAIAIVYLRFVLKLPRKTKISFVLAAGVYVSGALGIELLGGFYASHYGTSNYVYALISTIEEILEMTGVLIFINALVKFFLLKRLSIQLSICE